MKTTRWIAMVALLALAGCGDDSSSGGDAGFDAGGPVSCETNDDCPGTYCNMGSFLCCQPADPPYEICGDRIDQNCDGRDQACGDTDRDGISACRPGEDPLGGTCDCDDSRADVRPGFGSLAGAVEACDGVDNNCNGRIDESAACCEACSILGENRNRADICTVDDACVCTTSGAGDAPCPEGRACCAVGCADLQNDFDNCGFCNAQCTRSADRCLNGTCSCGDTGLPCDLDYECVDGECVVE